jgi:hypothetical protein
MTGRASKASKASKASRMGGCLLLLLIGCREAGSSVARTTVTDSAGITIVENHDAGTPAVASWIVDSVPTLAIGREDGPDPYRFDGIDDVARRSDSTIIVADASASIRFFDKRGEFLHAVGRRGEGPGEYRVISMMRRIHGDSLLIWDFGNRRVTVLAPDGEYARSMRSPGTLESFYGDDVFADGTILGQHDEGFTQEGSVTGIRQDTSTVVRTAPGSDSMDTLALIPTASTYISGGEHFLVRSIPFHADVVEVVAGRGAYIASSAQFDIGYYNPAGQLARIVRLDRSPTAIDATARKDFIAARLARARNDADRERIAASYEDLPFPDHFPAFSALAVDADSNLWASSFTTSDSLPTRWTIFEPEGRLLAETVTPAHFRVSEIGSSDIIGVRADSLGVEQVQVLGIRKPE